MLAFKRHSSYRDVIALCDASLLGKKVEEGNKQLEIKASFFKDQDIDHAEAVRMLQQYRQEDATFNIVGKAAIEAALEAEIIDKDSVSYVDSIPFALVLI